MATHISIAFMMGHYEVVILRGGKFITNTVCKYSVEDAEAQAAKWRARYGGMAIERPYLVQCEMHRHMAEMERETRVRNREREFAKAAGWTGEAYWVTAPLAELEAEQRKFASEYE